MSASASPSPYALAMLAEQRALDAAWASGAVNKTMPTGPALAVLLDEQAAFQARRNALPGAPPSDQRFS